MLAGKTTFARFLAWYFNIPLIESDFYLIPNQGFTYDVSEIDRIISFRKKLSRPVIVEGFCVLKTLAEIQTPPDIVIYVQNKLDNNIDEKLDCIQDYLGFNDAAYYKLKVSH